MSVSLTSTYGTGKLVAILTYLKNSFQGLPSQPPAITWHPADPRLNADPNCELVRVKDVHGNCHEVTSFSSNN